MAFDDVPITVDETELQDEAVTYLEAKVDGYALEPAHPETWLIELFSRMVSEAAFASTAPKPAALFRWAAENLFGIPPEQGTKAIGATTWTARDTEGHTIDAGTLLTIGDYAFTTDADVTIPAGQSSTAAGGVLITAVDIGSKYNNATGTPEPVDSITWVDGITLVGSTANGTDAETDDEFQARGKKLLRLQTRSPITSEDFETFVSSYDGVYRVIAIDDGSLGVTLSAIDSAGQPIGTALKAKIATDIAAKRQLNFVVTWVDPTYTAVTVNYAAVAYTGFDAATVKSEIDAALASYINSAEWGRIPGSDSDAWVQTAKVYYLQAARVIGNVPGVKSITTLTLNGSAADATLAGTVPLPTLTLDAGRSVVNG